MSWEATVMDEYARSAELTDLSQEALHTDVRWNRVSEVTAKAQAKISYEAGFEAGNIRMTELLVERAKRGL